MLDFFPRLSRPRSLGFSPFWTSAGGAGARGKAFELSAGKDTTTGHWEMMGLVVERPFPLYPDGFPDEIVDPFEAHVGKKVLGNVAASGTEIIRDLGEEHLATGRPILYTSGDSVFQLAVHEEVWAPERLWEVCRYARSLLTGKHAAGRVIARPFTGKPGAFTRTANRRDFTVEPTGGRGSTVSSERAGRYSASARSSTSSRAAESRRPSTRPRTPRECGSRPMRCGTATRSSFTRTSWTSTASMATETTLPVRKNWPASTLSLRLLGALRGDDLFLLTADHGCETTDVSTDHTREHVPFLAAGPAVKRDVDVGVRSGFADLAATAGEWLGVPSPRGTSALGELVR